MANRNGMGPEEKGPKTGRGLGPCGDGTPKGCGRGLGRGPGFKQKTKTDEDKA